jgi:hypothetical protein
MASWVETGVMGGKSGDLNIPPTATGIKVQRDGAGICQYGFGGGSGPAGRIIAVHPDGTCDVEWSMWMPPAAPPAAAVPARPALSPTMASWLDAFAISVVGYDVLKAAHPAAPAAKRDGNGSLLCGRCAQPYPYAEPASDGGFTCHSCKSYGDM